MKFTKQDIDELPPFAELTKMIDTIDANYVSTVCDEIFKKQPFLLTVLLGYQLDFPLPQFEEVMKVYFLIWEYFKKIGNVPTRLVTQELFEQIQLKNIQMLKYSEQVKDRRAIYDEDFQSIKSKSLLAAVFFRFNDRQNLALMDEETRGIVLFGIKTFIECFEY